MSFDEIFDLTAGVYFYNIAMLVSYYGNLALTVDGVLTESVARAKRYAWH